MAYLAAGLIGVGAGLAVLEWLQLRPPELEQKGNGNGNGKGAGAGAGAGTRNLNEQRCRAIFERLVAPHAVLHNVRPAWLRNPETGRNLELDMLCPDWPSGPVACEYNGSQHYHESELHRAGSDDFRRQQRRDRLKQRLCVRHGVRLIVVPFWERHRLEAFLRERL